MQPRRYQNQWILLWSILLALGALIGYWLYAERVQVESRERDRLQTQARVIDENLGRQLEVENIALTGVRNEYPLPLNKSAAQAASRHLKAISDAMPDVRTMTIADANGTVIASSRDELIGKDVSESEIFKAVREHPDPATFYVPPPFKTLLGVYSIIVGREAAGPRERFAGTISATLDPEYFKVLLGSVLYAPDMWTSLAHEDGRVFVIVPSNEQALGVDLNKPGSFRNRHLETGRIATVMTGVSTRTGEERMMAQRTVRRAGINMDKSIGIAVSRDIAAIYLPWQRQALAYGVLYALFAAMAILGMFFYQRRRIAFDRIKAVDETERRRAEDVLRVTSARLRQLSRRLIDVEDDVRRKINRELHDRVGASLSALNLNLSILHSQLPQESLRAVGARLDDTQKLLEETTAQVRDLMADLHPPALDDYGLHAALRSYVHHLGARFAAPIDVQGEPFVPRLPLAAETALFRVAQGALVNAVTHAQAKRIEILFNAFPDRLTLTIADDGVGFDVENASLAHASWGLAIMRERAEAVGATLAVESAPGKGTRVCVAIPRERR